MRVPNWTGFVLWALVSVLCGFTFLAMMSIGILILPIAITALVIAFRRLRLWPEILGFVLGPAAAMMFLAMRNWGLRRCNAGELPHVQASSSGTVSIVTGESSQTIRFAGCIDMDVHLLMWGGAALGIAALVAFTTLKYLKRTSGGMVVNDQPR